MYVIFHLIQAMFDVPKIKNFSSLSLCRETLEVQWWASSAQCGFSLVSPAGVMAVPISTHLVFTPVCHSIRAGSQTTLARTFQDSSFSTLQAHASLFLRPHLLLLHCLFLLPQQLLLPHESLLSQELLLLLDLHPISVTLFHTHVHINVFLLPLLAWLNVCGVVVASISCLRRCGVRFDIRCCKNCCRDYERQCSK